jgi:hypothetical protein
MLRVLCAVLAAVASLATLSSNVFGEVRSCRVHVRSTPAMLFQYTYAMSVMFECRSLERLCYPMGVSS